MKASTIASHAAADPVPMSANKPIVLDIRLDPRRRGRHHEPCFAKVGASKNKSRRQCYDTRLRDDEKLKCDSFSKARRMIAATGYARPDCETLEDIYSEAWLSLLRSDHEFLTATFIAKKMAWLYGDLLRRQRAEEQRIAEYTRRSADKQHIHLMLSHAAEEAPPEAQAIVKLKLAGYTHAEIAAQLEISVRTVNYRLESLKGNRSNG